MGIAHHLDGFVNGRAPEPELDTEARGAFQALVEALAALQREGLVRGGDTAMVATHVWAVVHGVAMLGIDGQLHEPVGVEALLGYTAARLWNGIEADTPRRAAQAGAARKRQGSRRVSRS